MSKPSGVPQPRVVTPEERSRAMRTFMWIVVGFVAAIGILVATLSVMGRGMRDYGQAAARAVQATRPAPGTNFTRPCADVLNKPMPGGVVSCMVMVKNGQVTALLKVEGDKQYRVKP
ncbi:hypothetical protein DEDE109153_03585 [Deinococcus deserti]|uniref:DUF4333 domain-containing protein n=1 Tax=Deinococcus deserti (strain DSM 17065 / CIP 109153 / LMG 22923 / VCD115) TaxID=546414 RepID=C1D1P4_DEIDV|nr:hypothetical protein [Deinococcus deserti]ACO45768.1 conserved hypothetical protein; putative membrane protein [Deinococcus deserti VCD115]